MYITLPRGDRIKWYDACLLHEVLQYVDFAMWGNFKQSYLPLLLFTITMIFGTFISYRCDTCTCILLMFASPLLLEHPSFVQGRGTQFIIFRNMYNSICIFEFTTAFVFKTHHELVNIFKIIFF